MVCVASTSMFSGNDTTRSMNERVASNAARATRARAELRHFGGEEPRHVDHRRVVFAERFDVESHHDRVVVRRLHRARDRRARIGHDFIGHRCAAARDCCGVPISRRDCRPPVRHSRRRAWSGRSG